MIIALIALVLAVFSPTASEQPIIVIPAMPSYAPTVSQKWDALSYEEYVSEYSDEFTELFNSYSYKVSKNGRSMINGKFVAMGAK
jgi:hypothetical protein